MKIYAFAAIFPFEKRRARTLLWQRETFLNYLSFFNSENS